MKTFKKAALYVLRGIAFAVYFPFYLLIRLLSLALDRVVSPAVDWLFRKVLFPAVLAFFKYIVAPVVKLFVGPLNWLWRFALRPAFEFGWKWILYPVLKYGIYIPLRFIWRHGLRWFWREIAIPVARYTGIVLAWLLRMIGCLMALSRLLSSEMGVEACGRSGHPMGKRRSDEAAAETNSSMVRFEVIETCTTRNLHQTT